MVSRNSGFKRQFYCSSRGLRVIASCAIKDGTAESEVPIDNWHHGKGSGLLGSPCVIDEAGPRAVSLVLPSGNFFERSRYETAEV